MEKLMEWLGKNPGVLIILFALAAPLWSYLRQNLSPQQGRPKPAPMPSFGGGPGERRPPAPPVQERPHMEPFREEEERKARLREAERREEAEERRERLERGRPNPMPGGTVQMQSEEGKGALTRPATPSGLPLNAGTPQAPAGQGPRNTALQAPDRAAMVPGKDDLARAVVWSEILGPPRAKKPYGR
jgi:hypothetical protein